MEKYKDIEKDDRIEEDFTLENGEKIEGEVIYSRIEEESIPKGKFLYAIRHRDDDEEYPATIEKEVVVNFLCSLVTKKKIDFAGKDYLEIKDTSMLEWCKGLDYKKE